MRNAFWGSIAFFNIVVNIGLPLYSLAKYGWNPGAPLVIVLGTFLTIWAISNLD